MSAGGHLESIASFFGTHRNAELLEPEYAQGSDSEQDRQVTIRGGFT
jgi:hypothetical protein